MLKLRWQCRVQKAVAYSSGPAGPRWLASAGSTFLDDTDPEFPEAEFSRLQLVRLLILPPHQFSLSHVIPLPGKQACAHRQRQLPQYGCEFCCSSLYRRLLHAVDCYVAQVL